MKNGIHYLYSNMETLTQNKKTIPEAPKQFLIGSLYYLFRDPYEFLLSNRKKYHSVYKLSNPLRKAYVVHHPDGIKHILQDNNKNYHKSFAYEILKILLGNGLLTSEGDFWRKQRRLAQPAFHRQRLANLFELMLGFSNELADDLEENFNGNAVDLAPKMMELTLKIVSKALFSSDVDVHVSKVGDSLDVVLEAAMNRIGNPLSTPRWIPTKSNLRENKAVDVLNEVVRGIIKERRNSNEQKDDLLGMLMEAVDEETGEKMDDQQLVDECMTIFLAGHETTAVGMSWLLYCLVKNPDKLEKVYAEIDSVLGGKKPEMSDLPQLTYTKMVVDESLRLYPPAWLIGRRSLEGDNIMGYDIPENSNMLLPVFAVHLDPRWWDKPDQFIPERFTKEEVAKRHKYAYFPFGGGPRLCIGNNFALMEMQIITIALLQRFKFKLKEGFEPVLDPLVTLRPRTGMWMSVEKR